MVTAEQFNKAFPVGTLVRYWAGIKEGRGTISETRSQAWCIGSGRPVVKVVGVAGGIALTHVEPVRDAICCYVIYDHPKDYPEEYVIRQHFAVNGQTHAARNLFGRGTTLDYVRTLLPVGLRNIGRFDQDDAAIQEVWI